MRKTLLAISILTLPSLLLTNVFAQNLTVETATYLPWIEKNNKIFNVMIKTDPSVSAEKIAIVKNVIMSKHVLFKDGKQFYDGWKGALEKASQSQTEYPIPTNFNFVESTSDQVDIIIILQPAVDVDGFAGFTTFVGHDKIVSSTIIIYNVNALSNVDLAAVARHEFGHALGLGHSTEYGDLMYEEVDSRDAYISEYNIHAIISLYNGNILSDYSEDIQL